MNHILTVRVPNPRVFNSYWYGNGTIKDTKITDKGYVVKVDYGTDYYRALHQAERFRSGLYFAEVTVKESTLTTSELISALLEEYANYDVDMDAFIAKWTAKFEEKEN